VTSAGLEPELTTALEDIRKKMYQWLSGFVHANWASQVVTAYPRGTGRHAKMGHGLRGEISANSRPTLFAAVRYMSFQLKLICVLLEREHEWDVHKDMLLGHAFADTMDVFNEAITQHWRAMKRIAV
jgi:hypothetical protein